MARLRNAGHRTASAARLASATGDMEQLAAAYDWFRASAMLLARRRPPRGIPQEVHAAVAARIIREITANLTATAAAIDRGDYDAQ